MNWGNNSLVYSAHIPGTKSRSRSIHRSRLLNEFAAHERVAGFARDVFLLLISALLYPVLGVLVVSKHALAYAVFVLSTGEHATNSPADTFYPSNVEFLESCLTFFQVRFN